MIISIGQHNFRIVQNRIIMFRANNVIFFFMFKLKQSEIMMAKKKKLIELKCKSNSLMKIN